MVNSMDPLPAACAREGGQETHIRVPSRHPTTKKFGILTSAMLTDQAGRRGNFAQATWRKDNGQLGERNPADRGRQYLEAYRSRKLTSIGVIVATGVPLGPTAGLKRQVRTASMAFSSSPRPAPFTT